MTTPDRKPDQAVEFDGARLPRGSQEGRPCDLRDCAANAAALVAAPDGSVLLVCSPHGEALTEPARVAAETRTGRWSQRSWWLSWRGPRVRASVALRLVLGATLIVWGLAVVGAGDAGASSEAGGIVTGSLGALLVISAVLPHRAR